MPVFHCSCAGERGGVSPPVVRSLRDHPTQPGGLRRPAGQIVHANINLSPNQQQTNLALAVHWPADSTFRRMNTTSLTLLERLREPLNDAAWNRFVSLYSPLLFAFARRAGMNDNDAADVVQDVFLVLMAELPRFEYDAARKNFRGWLKTISVNKCREHQRRRVIAIGQGGDGSGLSGIVDDATVDAFWEGEFQQHLTTQALRLMQTDFEPQTWQAAWLALTTDRTAADIGEELGLAEASVWVAKSRVLRKLRQEMAGMWDEP